MRWMSKNGWFHSKQIVYATMSELVSYLECAWELINSLDRLKHKQALKKTCVTAMQFIACLYYWPSFGFLVFGKTNIVGRERLDMKKISYLHAHEPYSKISFILHFIVECEKYSAMPHIFFVSTSLLNDSDGAIEKRKWGSGREREHRE